MAEINRQSKVQEKTRVQLQGGHEQEKGGKRSSKVLKRRMKIKGAHNLLLRAKRKSVDACSEKTGEQGEWETRRK